MYKSISIGAAAVVIFIIIFLSMFVVTVGPGQRGVEITCGKVGAVYSEGLHFKTPVQSVIKMNVRTQKTGIEACAASKDLQQTDSKIVLAYHIMPDKVNYIYQNIGKNYDDVIIQPSLQEIVKAVTAKYTAMELITSREQVSGEIQQMLKAKLLTFNIVVDNFSIVNFAFSRQFTDAIEAKQTAEQNAMKAQRDLERIKIEADQKIATAKAEAEALGMQRQQVTPEVLKLRWIEKWDGHLPTVSTNSMIPMIDMK